MNTNRQQWFRQSFPWWIVQCCQAWVIPQTASPRDNLYVSGKPLISCGRTLGISDPPTQTYVTLHCCQITPGNRHKCDVISFSQPMTQGYVLVHIYLSFCLSSRLCHLGCSDHYMHGLTTTSIMSSFFLFGKTNHLSPLAFRHFSILVFFILASLLPTHYFGMATGCPVTTDMTSLQIHFL